MVLFNTVKYNTLSKDLSKNIWALNTLILLLHCNKKQ
jgi:hypothetical protein